VGSITLVDDDGDDEHEEGFAEEKPDSKKLIKTLHEKASAAVKDVKAKKIEEIPVPGIELIEWSD